MCRSGSGELSIDTQAIRQLTITARAPRHAIARSHQREAASHLCAIRSAEISYNAPSVMCDGLEFRTHIK
jgi:hypothetical protein